MSNEILINTFSIEEMEGMEEEAEKNLYRKMLIVDSADKIKITDIITGMRKRLKNEILNKNN